MFIMGASEGSRMHKRRERRWADSVDFVKMRTLDCERSVLLWRGSSLILVECFLLDGGGEADREEIEDDDTDELLLLDMLVSLSSSLLDPESEELVASLSVESIELSEEDDDASDEVSLLSLEVLLVSLTGF